MTDICCLCGKPIIDGEPVHGAYREEGTQRHYACHVKAHPVFDHKAEKKKIDDLLERTRKSIAELRRITRGK